MQTRNEGRGQWGSRPTGKQGTRQTNLFLCAAGGWMMKHGCFFGFCNGKRTPSSSLAAAEARRERRERNQQSRKKPIINGLQQSPVASFCCPDSSPKIFVPHHSLSFLCASGTCRELGLVYEVEEHNNGPQKLDLSGTWATKMPI
jgi:hypothetical protein